MLQKTNPRKMQLVTGEHMSRFGEITGQGKMHLKLQSISAGSLGKAQQDKTVFSNSPIFLPVRAH